MLNVHPLIFIPFPGVLCLSLLLGHGGRREGEMWQVVSISLPEEAWLRHFYMFARTALHLVASSLVCKCTIQGAFYIMLDTCFFSVTPKTSLSRARFLVLQLTTGELFADPGSPLPACAPSFAIPSYSSMFHLVLLLPEASVTFYTIIVCTPYKDMSM